MLIKALMVALFAIIAIVIGIICRKHASNVSGFILGGRNVGPWLSAFAFGTSYFSAVIFVGYAGQFGWKYGLAATWIGIGNAILGSLLAWWILGPRTREMTRHLQAATMPEFFGKRFSSTGLRIAAAAIIFVFLIPYTASVYNGLSRLFGMAFGLPYEVCVIGMALITCIYAVLGGYMATVVNDFVQGIVMLFGIVAVVAAVLAGNGGFSEAVVSLSQIPAENSALEGAFVSMFGPDLPNLIGVIILTSLGTWGLPQMVQKFYAIKSGPAIKQGAIISTLFAVVVKNMSEKSQLLWMRGLLVVFVVISAAIALVQYNSSITFIAQLMSISWGALAGAFLGPFFWGLYSKRISKAAVWASFIVGVGLTTGNMIAGFFGTPLIASPINCGALAMVLSMAIVPLVSLVTKPIPFDIDIALPSRKSATDREIEAEMREEQVPEMDPVA